MTYILIFITKVVENALSTLRLIVIANGKKLLGAILNFLVAIAWVVSTSLVVQNFKDIVNVLAFASGCFIGSYIGSIIENKLGLGSNLLMVISNKNKEIGSKIQGVFKYYTVENVIFILTERKKRAKVLELIYNVDDGAIIISEIAHELVHKLNKDRQ